MVEKRKEAQSCYGTLRKRGDIKSENRFIGAIYGDYGSGKTYLSGTIDKCVRDLDKKQPLDNLQNLVGDKIKVKRITLFANAEQGEEGLPVDCPNILIYDIGNYKDFSNFYEFLKYHCRALKKNDINTLISLQSKFFKIPENEIDELWIVQAVIVDSLTEVQKYCLYQLIGITENTKLEEEPEYMDMRKWGVALEMILSMVRKFRALPMYVTFIIQQVEDTDEKKRLFYRPALQGQAKSSILGFFDFVGYYEMTVKKDTEVNRRLYLLPIGPFKAKHRMEGFTGKYIDNPSMEDICKYKMMAPEKNETTVRRGVRRIQK